MSENEDVLKRIKRVTVAFYQKVLFERGVEIAIDLYAGSTTDSTRLWRLMASTD